MFIVTILSTTSVQYIVLLFMLLFEAVIQPHFTHHTSTQLDHIKAHYNGTMCEET